jgi:hypothetical protein
MIECSLVKHFFQTAAPVAALKKDQALIFGDWIAFEARRG